MLGNYRKLVISNIRTKIFATITTEAATREATAIIIRCMIMNNSGNDNNSNSNSHNTINSSSNNNNNELTKT